jgi:hypothetical protein
MCWLKLGRHKTISSSAISHEDSLAWLEFGEAPSAERLHMHEYVGCLGATREKAKPAQPIEPLHHRSFPITLCRDDNMGALRQLRWTNCRRIVHAADACGL